LQLSPESPSMCLFWDAVSCGVSGFLIIALPLLELCVTFHQSHINKGRITFLTLNEATNSYPCARNLPDCTGNRVQLCGDPLKRISFRSLTCHLLSMKLLLTIMWEILHDENGTVLAYYMTTGMDWGRIGAGGTRNHNQDLVIAPWNCNRETKRDPKWEMLKWPPYFFFHFSYPLKGKSKSKIPTGAKL
jgi:hypothetical protein